MRQSVPMKRAVVPVLSLLLGVCLLGAVRKPLPVLFLDAAVSNGEGRHMSVASGTIARALAAVVVPARKGVVAGGRHDDDRAAIRQRVKDAEAGTYISDILRERDSSLARWA